MLVLDDQARIRGGRGVDGMGGFQAANVAPAYLFRLNCTVGFYNSAAPSAKTNILAVRLRPPFRNDED